MTLQVLRRCLDGAVRCGWLKENPGRQVDTLREDRTDPNPFSLDEVTTFLTSGLRADWQRRYFEVAFFTGLRPSEQIGLRWADVDRARDLIGIRRAVSRFGEGTTKTKGSAREVPMLPRVKLALQQQRGETEPHSAWVFPNERGGRLHIANLRERVWKPALRRAGLRYRTMYQTRHTFATLALSSGEALDWVARVLGHTTTAMVIRHYHKYVQTSPVATEPLWRRSLTHPSTPLCSDPADTQRRRARRRSLQASPTGVFTWRTPNGADGAIVRIRETPWVDAARWLQIW
jgi:integrase